MDLKSVPVTYICGDTENTSPIRPRRFFKECVFFVFWFDNRLLCVTKKKRKPMKTKQLFVNLPVKNLKKSIAFFSALGFSFNPTFTNESGACLILGADFYAMLLVEDFFLQFTSKAITDSGAAAEVINALMVESREEVDAMMTRALDAGAVEHRPPQDHGFMYGRSFQDIDGHLWEIGWMEETPN